MTTLKKENADALETERRFRELLPHLDETQVAALLDSLEELEQARVIETRTGLVMLTVTDVFGENFYLGEALAATAEVELGGVKGHATVLGEDELRAVLAAVLHAAGRRPEGGAPAERFRTELKRCAAAVERELEREARLTAATRVEFKSMAAEKA